MSSALQKLIKNRVEKISNNQEVYYHKDSM